MRSQSCCTPFYCFWVRNILLRSSLSYAKIVQTECRKTSLLEFFAEVQPILCKDNASERNVSLLTDCQVQLILCKDKAFLLYIQELPKEKYPFVDEVSSFSIFYHWKDPQKTS